MPLNKGLIGGRKAICIPNIIGMLRTCRLKSRVGHTAFFARKGLCSGKAFVFLLRK